MNMQNQRSFSPDMGREVVRELPNNLEAEQQILGMVLMNNDAITGLPETFSVGHLFDKFHRELFEAIQSGIRSGKTINPYTVKSFLPASVADIAIGDLSVSQYLSRLASNRASIDNIGGFASAVTFEAVKREGLSVAESMDISCWEARSEIEFAEKLTECCDRLTRMRSVLEGREVDGDEKVLDDYLKMITGENEADGADGIPLPFPDFEHLINDNMLRPGRIYGMLGASAEGKTSLTLQVVYAALMAGHPVAYLSFDQDQMEILAQITAQQEGIPFSSQIQNSRNHQRLSQQQIDNGYAFVRRLKQAPFEVIPCTTRDTVARLGAKIDGFMRRRANGKMPLFIFDHIRAIRSTVQGDEGSKALQIGQDIKDVVKARRGAGWILQQRSTGGLKRENPRPASADLYGGDAAKQPFDVIFYVFRASEHREEQVKTAKDENEAEKIRNRFSKIYGKDRDDEYLEVDGYIEVGMIKNRFGNKNRRAILKFDPEYTRFSSRRQAEQGSMFS
jgi:replicative DNA helicase